MIKGMKRALAMLLALSMTFGNLSPMTVFAEETDAAETMSNNLETGESSDTGCDTLGHSWVDADCDTAKTCSVCGETEGEALGHTWEENACSVCGLTKCEALGHSWVDADCDTAKTCSVCGATEGEALGHSWVDADCDTAKTCSVCGATEGEALGHSWVDADCDTARTCSVCGATEEVQQLEEEVLTISDEELTVEDYDTFLAELKVLEGYAQEYASSNSKYSDAGLLVVNFIRTGVERYMTPYWSGLAGTEITGFATYVQQQDAANGTTAMRLKNIVIESFTLPNGNPADFGHMFGCMNILYYNSSIYSQDIAGWAGDLCDLLLYSRDHGDVPEDTVDEMAAFILEKCFGVDADDAFGWDDFYGDMDAYYLVKEWKGSGKKLSSLMEAYFTSELDDSERSAYFMNNRFSGLETREDVRTAVYEAYTNNTAIKMLEADEDRLLTDVNPDLRMAACYAFADYLFNEGGDKLEGDVETPTDPSDPDEEEPTDPTDPDEGGDEEEQNPYYTDFSVTETFLAPGISQSIHYALSADNKQMVYYVATVDVTRDDVTIMANYRNADPSQGWGMQRVTDQADALMKKHTNPEDPDNYIENFNVVVATNGDGFNTSTGQPGGLLVMGGVEYHPVDGDGFFAILKDGTAMIGTKADYEVYKDQIQEAIGGFGATLIADGKIAVNKSSTYYNSRASRTAIGITASGAVVMMVLDGRQEPFSCGGSMEEIAQIMLEAGCVHAINLDGGGSTTYASKPEGADSLALVNRPSDGYQRNVAASLAAVSTSKMTNEFDHANITFDYDYLTIGSSVTGTAVGVSGSGNAATIPEDAVWQVSDETIGSITEDGVFTASANGDVEVRLIQGEKVLGTKTLHVVVPDGIAFEKDSMNIIFGVPVELPVLVSYRGNPVAFNENDIIFGMTDDNAGSIEGMFFTANEEAGVRRVTLGVMLMNPELEVYAMMDVSCYKDGEAFFDFADITGGSRQLAWKRGISNSTTQDKFIYNIDDPTKPMEITYVFGLDMKEIEVPEKLADIVFMLGGAEGSTAWDYLLMFAERISVLTEVVVTAKFDEDLDIDYSELSFMNDYFTLTSATLDEETNVLTIKCNWVDQTQAIDSQTANPICILSGIKATPKEGASWNGVSQLEIINGGDIRYDIYARFSSLYTFAKDPANQEKFGLYPYSSDKVLYNGGPEQGGHFFSTYASFEDAFTLDKSLKQGWYTIDDQTFYFIDHKAVTGIQKVPSKDDPSVKLFYEFDENGACKGTVTGIFDYNDGKCYAIMGVQKFGWIATYDAKGNAADYYFDPYTGMAVNGACKVEGYNYEFTNYILTKGELVTDANGTRYRWAGLWQHGKWFEHEGNIYHLPRYVYYVVTGYSNVVMPDGTKHWCLFDENGVFQANYSGKYDYEGKTYLLKDGVKQEEPGLVLLDDGYYYYFSADGSAIKNRTYWPTKTNGLLPMGPYVFDDLGRITNPPVTEPDVPDVPDVPETPVEKKNGVYELNSALYYYKDDVIQYCAGLVQLEDGSYIYVRSNGQLAIGNYWTTTTNGFLPQGIYHFGEDGVMTNPPGSEPEEPDTPVEPEPVKEGIYEESGALYYYKNGTRAHCAGLLKLEDGSYIYVRSNAQLATGKYWITTTNDLLPQQLYTFGEDGRMIDPPATDQPDMPDNPEEPEVKNGVYVLNGSLYYYENDAIQYGAGIKQMTDDSGATYYIYVRSNGQLAIGNYWPTTTNGLLAGNRMYTFDANGRYYPA